MNPQQISSIAILLYSIVFFLFFRNEGLGINTLIFTSLLVPFMYYSKPTVFSNKYFQALLIALFISTITIILYNSDYACWMFLITALLLIGKFHQVGLNYTPYIALNGLYHFLFIHLKIKKNIVGVFNIKWLKIFRVFSIIWIPLLIVFLFFVIYSIANLAFAQGFINAIVFIIEKIEAWDISFQSFFFWLLGVYILISILLEIPKNIFDEKHKPQNIIRKRTQQISNTLFSFLALKKEYYIAFITFLLLNILLLIVNITDINHVWFSVTDDLKSYELRSFVHQGTYVLIVSIIMAAGLVLYFFRKNLHFYPKNKWLKYLTYLWIAQNIFLSFSVGMRNWHYIQQFGLAYKRIGVFIFLLLTLIGLITLFIKVSKAKSFSYMVQKNMIISYSILLLFAFVNWDVWITHYNIQTKNKNKIDVPFLVNDVSDKNLYILIENQAILKQYSNMSSNQIDHFITNKAERFKKRTKNHSWLSWNWADYKNKKYLNQ